MDYPRFVALRRPLWDGFEKRLAEARARGPRIGHQEVEALAFQYRQVLHDHALAAARYPGTAAARRLRGLALAGTHWLRRDQGDRMPGLLAFFGRVFPTAFRAQAGQLGVMVALFAAMTLAGLTLSLAEPSVGATFLGQKAMSGLAHGHLWTESLVSTVPPAFASSGIATNNMSVALTGWAGGALAGLGAFWIVLLNGFMLGAMLGVTMHYSLAGLLLEFVSAHGPLEITLILVTASAGLSIGRALVAAEDRPRGEALREASRGSLAVLLGCLPWFLVLAVVEAFLSPSPDLAPAFKAALGLALLLLFLTAAWNPFLDREPHA